MAEVTINVKGMDTLRKELAEVEVSPALQQAISEAMRQSIVAMDGKVARAVAVSAASRHIAEMRQRQADAERSKVTRAMLAELGVRQLE